MDQPAFLQFLSGWRSRLGVVAVWVVVWLGWLAGSELILGLGRQVDALSETDVTFTRICLAGLFLLVNAWGFYKLLARVGPTAAVGILQERLLLERSPGGVAVCDAAGIVRYANPMFLRLLDLSPAIIGQADLDTILQGRLTTDAPIAPLPGTGRRELSFKVRYATGRESEVELAMLWADLNGQDCHLLFASDVTRLRRTAETSTMYDQTLATLPLGLVIFDATRAGYPILYANEAFQASSGQNAAELLGMPCTSLSQPGQSPPGTVQLADAFENPQTTAVTIRRANPTGQALAMEMIVSTVRDRTGQARYHVALQQDVTADRLERVRLAHELYNDAVTPVQSRAGFVRGLQALLSNPAHHCILLVRIDLQGFHDFNTALGWSNGDLLLAEVASRLQSVVPGNVIGRVDSNQFAAALPIEPQAGPAMVDTIREALQGRYVLPGTTYEPIIAIGWTVGLAGAGSWALLQQSSVALKDARQRRTGVTRQFDVEMEAVVRERQRLTTELKNALQDKDFLVHYQPRVDLRTGEIIAAEALIRWNHRLFGMQAPARFMALAEQTGLIVEIGEVSLQQAIAVAASINRDRARPIPVSVNVSFAQFRQREFVRLVETTLAAAGASPAWLQLELPETIYVESTPGILQRLQRLHGTGVGLIIDDFATGLSSLRYLADKPVDEIKIDRSFVSNIEQDGVARAVTMSILSMAKAKHARVGAQAVETERQREILLELGCTIGQGYLFCEPLPLHEFTALLAGGNTLPTERPRAA